MFVIFYMNGVNISHVVQLHPIFTLIKMNKIQELSCMPSCQSKVLEKQTRKLISFFVLCCKTNSSRTLELIMTVELINGETIVFLFISNTVSKKFCNLNLMRSSKLCTAFREFFPWKCCSNKFLSYKTLHNSIKYHKWCNFCNTAQFSLLAIISFLFQRLHL